MAPKVILCPDPAAIDRVRDHRTTTRLGLALGPQRYAASDSLQRLGYLPVEPARRDASGSAEFLIGYIAQMGRLALLNRNHPLWWATYLSARGRVGSPLPGLLHELVTILRACDEAGARAAPLVVVGVSWPVIVALGPYLAARGMSVQIVARPFDRLRWRWCGSLVAWAKFLRDIARAVRDSWSIRRLDFAVSPGDKPVVLVKSFAYPSSIDASGAYRESFFGDLLEQLRERIGDSVDVLTLVSASGDKRSLFARVRGAGAAMIPVDAVVPVSAVIRLGGHAVWTLLRRRIRVPDSMEVAGVDIAPMLRSAFASGGWWLEFDHLIVAEAVRCLSTKRQLVAFLLTHEGIPWERLAIQALRREAPNVPVIAYQHAAFPMAAAGLFWEEDEATVLPRPDLVLATGPESARIMASFRPRDAGPILSAGALRFPQLGALRLLPRPRREGPARILVVMEGLNEVTEMLAYALQQARLGADITFVLRAHPELPLDDALRILGTSRSDLPRSAVPSTMSLAEDVASADAVLYWGSTAALEAVLMGRSVIHFDRGDPVSYDPLAFMESRLHASVSGADALGPVLARFRALSDDAYAAEQTAAIRYVREFLAPAPETPGQSTVLDQICDLMEHARRAQ